MASHGFPQGAAARGLPQVPKALPKGLAVRGGVSQDTITNTAAGLFMASGLFTYISPAKNMEAYGVASITEDQSAYARYLGMIQMASAATLIAGMTKGAEFATAFSMSAAAIALLASIPGFEKLGTPKEPGAIWYVPRKEEGEESHHGITKLTHSLLLPSLPPLGSWAWVSSARRLGRA